MKIKLPTDSEPGFQMAPMIDITFLLIIFFMVVAKQTQTQFKKIEQAISVNSVVAQERADRGVVTIDSEGEIYVGAFPGDLDAVKEMVKSRIERNPEFKVMLRVDSSVRHERVREVLSACAESGALNIIFSTVQSEG